MNKIILLFLICFLQFANATNPPLMSECYSYHTPHFYEVFTENNHIILQHTVKDPNGISYVSRDKIVLDSISSKGFKILAKDAEKILFTTVDGYFLMEKDRYEMTNYGVSKITDSTLITDNVGTDLICKNGLWYYISPQNYSNEIVSKVVKDVPDNLEVYQTEIVREGPLMKNNEAVFIFNIDQLTFKQIPNLSGKNTRFVRTDERYKQGFIYDDDTFYFIAFDELIDYTKQFTSQEAFTTFKNAEIIKHQYEVSIDTNDGYIWLYLRFEIEDDQGIRRKITPVKASYLGKNQEFVYYKDKAYNDFSDLLRNYSSIDISAIENPTELETNNYNLYSDGKNTYEFDYNKNKFNILKSLPKNLDYHPPINSYQNMTTEFYTDDTKIYFLKYPNKISKSIKHTSAIKNLELAYTYDDKLLIENKEIKNSADRESMEFLGSTVDVISGCDGGNGQYPVEIDIYYFFKDKDNIYVYNTRNQKMRKLENQRPSESKIDNYDYLMQLMKVV